MIAAKAIFVVSAYAATLPPSFPPVTFLPHGPPRALDATIHHESSLQVQDMADWADYLKAKGVPLPHRKPKHKWV